MAKITYFDFSNIVHASFFMEGFKALQEEGSLEFKVSKRIPAEIEDLELTTWITYRKPPSTLVFRYEDAASNFIFCIDSNDHNGQDPTLPDIYPGYHFPLIERVKFYFKVNYHEEFVKNNPRLSPHRQKIIPLPLAYPLRLSQARSFLPKLTPFGKHRWPLAAVKGRVREMKQLLPLQEYRRLREMPRDLDVFFLTIIYMREDHEEINARRLKLLEAIDKNSKLNTSIGLFCSDDNLPPSFARFQRPRMPFETYMSQLARSKIGIYTRGTYGCISFKFGQYFALGKPIVGETLLNNRRNMYAYDQFSEQFAFDEPQEIAERVAFLVANPDKLEQLRQANTATFERHFTPAAVVGRMMAQVSQELPAKSRSAGILKQSRNMNFQ